MPLYFLRHGETQWNRVGRMQGQKNSDLTELGQQQAQHQAAILAHLGVDQKTPAFCSPLGRTRQTAQYALADWGTDITFDPLLMEIGVGSWEGMLREDIIAKHPEIFETDLSVFDRFCASPDGEGYDGIYNRMDQFLSNCPETAVVVSHGIAISILRGICLGLSRSEIASLDHPQGKVIEIHDGSERIHA